MFLFEHTSICIYIYDSKIIYLVYKWNSKIVERMFYCCLGKMRESNQNVSNLEIVVNETTNASNTGTDTIS